MIVSVTCLRYVGVKEACPVCGKVCVTDMGDCDLAGLKPQVNFWCEKHGEWSVPIDWGAELNKLIRGAQAPEDDFPKHTRTYICNFCLSPHERQFGDTPERCDRCLVGVCANCGSFLKDESKLCYGCGMIKPNVQARMSPADGTACLYMQDHWMRRNCGRRSTGMYAIATEATGVKLVKRTENNASYKEVRELTDKEQELLK